MAPEQPSDHDLLIEIRTKQDLFFDRFIDHEKEDAARYAVIEKDIKAAHRRTDMLTISGVLALVFLGITLWMKT